jgi:hypothetical protein
MVTFIRVCVFIVAVAAMLLIGRQLLGVWIAERVVGAIVREGGPALAEQAKAAIGPVVAHGGQRDPAYFETWLAAVEIADRCPTNCREGEWLATDGLPWLAHSTRVDAWGHAFCVQHRRDTTIVVSAGFRAVAAPTCGQMNLRELEGTDLLDGRLHTAPSGHIVLVVTHHVAAERR